MTPGIRLQLVIQGAVQGIGFRPFVYRLATELGLCGWVLNSPQGVLIEVEGDRETLELFQERFYQEKPALAYIQNIEAAYLDPLGFDKFEIRASRTTGDKTVLVLPDIATCPQCLEEIHNPSDRRYQYPFTNCTLCGPRYSIMESLPYDRTATSMKQFIMCRHCQEEFHDANNRRFHAQPNACPECGPQSALWDGKGSILANKHGAILKAAEALLEGKIVAVKGLGGFHLLVDARNDEAIDRLRQRKKRSDKPFAVMLPNLDAARQVCQIGTIEQRALTSPAAPIVLLKRRTETNLLRISERVAPKNPTLGILLPYTPLHHILMKTVGVGVVATSGNISEEPICIDEHQALARLTDIADLFLVHNRPIVRPVEDSVVRVVMKREMMIRRSRGFAPMPIKLPCSAPPTLAVGAHQKNTFALQVANNAFISQHIGSLETIEAFDTFQSSIEDLKTIFNQSPQQLVCDLHPDYLSTKYAEEQKLPLLRLQHHQAHVFSCMADNQLSAPVLGVAWDGTGFGLENTVWGGEFFQVEDDSIERVCSFRRFKLPGGNQAIKEPRRSALGLLFEIFDESLLDQHCLTERLSFSRQELETLIKLLKSGYNTPRTSSVGRIFDGVAALAGLNQIASYEGQAAVALENIIGEKVNDELYPFTMAAVIDWSPMILAIIDDLTQQLSLSLISQKLHNTLARIIVTVARSFEEKRVVLSGGCFQNKVLTERSIQELKKSGFKPYWHQRVPPNDGGIALGQLFASGRSCKQDPNNHNRPSQPRQS